MRYSTVYFVAKVVCFVWEHVWELRFSYLQTYGELHFVFLSCLILDNSSHLIGFFLFFLSYSRIFTHWRRHYYWWKAIYILICALHSMPLSSEGSLVCHTYCYTGQLFKMVISRTRDTHTFCLAFGSGALTTCFNDLGLLRL